MSKNKFITMTICGALLFAMTSCGTKTQATQSSTAVSTEQGDTTTEIETVTDDTTASDTPQIEEPVLFISLTEENKSTLSEELGITTEDLNTIFENKKDNLPPTDTNSDAIEPPTNNETMNNIPPDRENNEKGGEDMNKNGVIPVFENEINSLTEITSKSYDDLLNILKQYEAETPNNISQ